MDPTASVCSSNSKYQVSLQTASKRTAIFVQDECLKHRYIRSRDTSRIVECPERLHAVKLGLAAAISRIEEIEAATDSSKPKPALAVVAGDPDDGDLAEALARMAIAPGGGTGADTTQGSSSSLRTNSVTIQRTIASVSLLKHPAVKYVHGDIDGDVYLENLVAWAHDSQANIAKKGTEIPEGIPPLDLYLCPDSIDAIQGAVGAICEAVDASISSTRGPQLHSLKPDGPCERAFVAIRPPGHHCGEDTPSGFCFINNVAIGAAHAHLKHGIQRIVILDIDLHHGNGTQSIAWQINEETYRQVSESEESGLLPKNPGPRIFYGSLHDVLSFPCEEGKPEMIQAASTSIHGPHGQYIENIHLQRYESKAHFWDALYPKYLTLVHHARRFLDDTGGPGDDDIMIFISCGFDAGEHEYPTMSRHQRKVPVGFYHQFTREVCRLADQYAHGRVVSVLEGGYSDRALTSGAMAHLCGLVDIDIPLQGRPSDSADSSSSWVDHAWWDENNLGKLEKAVKLRKSAPARASLDPWVVRTLDLLAAVNGMPDDAAAASIGIKTASSSSSSRGKIVSASSSGTMTSMTLRERKKPSSLDGLALGQAPGRTASAAESSSGKSGKAATGRSVSAAMASGSSGKPLMMELAQTTEGRSKSKDQENEVDRPEEAMSGEVETRKKLPRVILHVRPPNGT